MADPNVYRDPPVGRTALPREPAVMPSPYATMPGQQLSPEQMAEADLYFAQLAEEAVYEEWKYQSARVPAHLQEYWLTTHPDPSVEAPPEGGVLAQRAGNPVNADPNFDPRVRR